MVNCRRQSKRLCSNSVVLAEHQQIGYFGATTRYFAFMDDERVIRFEQKSRVVL